MSGKRSLVVGALCLTAVVSFLPVRSFGTLITVRQDGTGDYLTITDAVNAASSTDTIDVGEGVYHETVTVSKSLVFLCQSGADLTAMDGQGVSRLMMIRGGATVEVVGLTFANAYGDGNGGAVRVEGGSVVEMRECVFSANVATYDGAAFFVRDTGSVLTLEDCLFTGNSAAHHGGAGNAVLGSMLNVYGCTFIGNNVGIFGTLGCNDGTMNVTESVFHANTTGDLSGAVYFYRSFGLVRSNTFHENDSPGFYGASVVVQESNTVVNRNIFSRATTGYGLTILDSAVSHTCNLYWQNERTPIYGENLNPDEMEADPLFCGVASDDFTISSASPGAPSHSPCGQLIGALPPACTVEPIPDEPVISSITDIGNDQGRKVRIVWQRSRKDDAGFDDQVSGYAIYRRQDAFMSAAASSSPEDSPCARSPQLLGWDYVITVPARGDAFYQVVAPTLCDSTIEQGMCWSVFFVSAMTDKPLVYFDSAPDSGYSLDNLAPSVPSGFSVTYYMGGGNELSWEPSDDEDFRHFRIYRGTNPEFVPGPDNLLHVTIENEWLDDVESGSLYHYKISAVDHSGNESEPALPIEVTEVTGAQESAVPSDPALYGNVPNPFNPSTIIRYDVPSSGGMVTITIYDVSGRVVRTIVKGQETPGQKKIAWDGRDDRGANVSSGVYFCRMTLGSFTQTRKMILTR